MDSSQRYALDLAKSGARRILILGAAGTGKSTVIKAIKETLEAAGKTVLLTAPTGIAAINIGGATIHSQFEIPAAIASARSLRDSRVLSMLLKNTDTIIIDEISMVRSDLMEAVLKRIGQYNPNIQLILVGDLMQLPPVLTEGETSAFKQAGYDPSFPYFTDGARGVTFDTAILTTCHRQGNGLFLDSLNKIRTGTDIQTAVNAFNANCRRPGTEPEPLLYLTTTNESASRINERRLAALDAEPRTFTAGIRYYTPSHKTNAEKEFPAPETLTVKPGANVMITKNIYPAGSRGNMIPNGAIGRITGISNTAIEVTLFTARPGYRIKVTPETWAKIHYIYDTETKTIMPQKEIEFSQFPLKLAWAVTIHKSQGLTLDNYAIDMGKMQFTDNLAYVALSRGRNFSDITLLSPLQLKDVRTNSRMLKFIAAVKGRQRITLGQIQQILSPPSADSESVKQTREIIERAISAGKDIEFDYINNDGEMSRRRVTPNTCILSASGNDILKAFCHLRHEERAFIISKIMNIKLIP
ncbi:MAG: AAA family ATPase [Synergistes sp.]|nr:AAA family ATPase [Synergistes sp.]